MFVSHTIDAFMRSIQATNVQILLLFFSACSIELFFTLFMEDNIFSLFHVQSPLSLSSVGALNLKNKSQQLHNSGRESLTANHSVVSTKIRENEMENIFSLFHHWKLAFIVFLCFPHFFFVWFHPNYPRDPFLHVKSHPFSLLMLSQWFISCSRCWYDNFPLARYHGSILFSIFIFILQNRPNIIFIQQNSNKEIAANFITLFYLPFLCSHSLKAIRVSWAHKLSSNIFIIRR